MNYNNFKRHTYHALWFGTKNADGTYLTIQVVFTRDYPYQDGGDIVINPFEVKYACKTIGFDYSSLQKVYNCYFIKVNSIEWNKYLEKPGENTEPEKIKLLKKERVLVSELREKGIEVSRPHFCGETFLVKGDEKIIEEILASVRLRCANKN